MRESLARGGARAKEERGLRQRRVRSEDTRMTSVQRWTSRSNGKIVDAGSAAERGLLDIERLVNDEKSLRARVCISGFPTNDRRQGSFLGFRDVFELHFLWNRKR